MKSVLVMTALLCALSLPVHVCAQARWISDPQAAAADASGAPISLQFRRELMLRDQPATLRVRVSADNRFVLYVNQRRVGAGPARGDLAHWRYEVLDLAPFLQAGPNVIAAQVWRDGKAAPLAQITSGHTAFWLSAEDPERRALLDTGTSWQVRVDASRTVEPTMPRLRQLLGDTFYAAGGQETIEGSLQAPDWADRTTRASGWHAAVLAKTGDTPPWTLVADTLPQMRFDRVESGRLVRLSGMASADFPQRALTVPANSQVTLLIDAGRVLAAYPALVLSGGAGAQVTASYVEALYDPKGRSSGVNVASRVRFEDRATVKDGVVLGVTDTFKPDGGARRRYEPFWWRTWRFVEIKVKTAAQPLTLEGFETWETGYPFEQRGRFMSNDTELNALWQIGWMTALLDAHETYMDTAYWEQLQYIGDTRIQMLISYDVSGDTRLAIQALDAFDHSRAVEGLPQSSYPGSLKQVIPPFGLLWVGSLHDYWMHQPDTEVIRRTLSGTRAVLDEYVRYIQPTGLVGPTPGWSFVDWRPNLDGWAERGKGVLSCVISMQYVGALNEAADLEQALGEAPRATKYRSLASKVRDGVNAECWDEKRGLYADTPAKSSFSQHGAVLAVLYDIAPAERHRSLLEKVTVRGSGIDAPGGITSTSYYFSFYLARAFEHAGLADRYLELLKPWRTMLSRNFTTWPETPEPSRSDTHAWSAHPTSGLLRVVAGIQSDAPGFARVRVQPHLGSLTALDAALVHPRGLIETKYNVRGSALSALVTLPEGVTGSFVWQGQRRDLKSGRNEFTVAR
jgi:alpha-L-rhamnosidase